MIWQSDSGRGSQSALLSSSKLTEIYLSQWPRHKPEHKFHQIQQDRLSPARAEASNKLHQWLKHRIPALCDFTASYLPDVLGNFKSQDFYILLLVVTPQGDGYVIKEMKTPTLAQLQASGLPPHKVEAIKEAKAGGQRTVAKLDSCGKHAFSRWSLN